MEAPTTQPTIEQELSEPKHRTLLEKWRNYTSGLSSPDNFINFGFYFLIGACLQRRVWTSADHMPLFGNQYTILTGPPATGKGLVIKSVNNVLKYHDYDPKEIAQYSLGGGKVEDITQDLINSKNAKTILQLKSQEIEEGKNGGKERKLLFPAGPDTTTFEMFVQKLGKSIRRINFKEKDGSLGFYTHCSMYFNLEELSSLFRRHKEDVGKFLLNAYDCGDYDYETKKSGSDYVRRLCVGILAGTTPDFLEESYQNHIMEQGLSSRMWFVYEPCNRKNVLIPPQLTDDQLKDFADILAHVKMLSRLYGHAPLSSEAREYLEKWWDNECLNRSNYHPKLQHYYGRKNIHVMKLAMCIHFADSFEMEIPLSACLEAIKQLGIIEKNMHHALCFGKNNPLAKKSQRVLEVLKRGPLTKIELHLEVWDDCKEGEFKEILTSLIGFEKIEQFKDEDGELKLRIKINE